MNSNNVLNQRHVKAALKTLKLPFKGSIYNDLRKNNNRMKLFGCELAHDNPQGAAKLKATLSEQFPNHTIEIKPWTSDARTKQWCGDMRHRTENGIKSTVITFVSNTIDLVLVDNTVIEWQTA
tara:strand:- start:9409 stop:9777 length:369 start_codon:yes stop_codon:yes gene_type:complete